MTDTERYGTRSPSIVPRSMSLNREPTRIGPTFEPGVGNVWPEPQATVWRLLGGRAPAASGLAVEAGRGILPGITISPMHGGPSVPDADGIAIELNALIADGHSLAKHVAKTQAADADRTVLILLPNSTWGGTWDLRPDRLGRGPMPACRLEIADPSPIEVWLVGERGLVWVYAHPTGEWRQRQDQRQVEDQ